MDSRSASLNVAEGDFVVPMESMGEAYQRLANNNRVGGAVKAGSAYVSPTPFSGQCDEGFLFSACCMAF